MPADVCPHSSKQVANCWCDAKMCLVKQKNPTKNNSFRFLSAHWQRLHVFPDTVIRNFKLILILTAWKCVSETSPAKSQKNLNVDSRISVKSDGQKMLNPEEGTTNALSTIYQMLHVFFPLNYNLKKQTKKLIEMTNVSLRSFSFSFSLQVMKAPALTSNNSVWELTSKTTINCNPVKSPLSQLLISRVLLPALALWMDLVKCYWRWMGSGCCGSRVLKVALKHPPPRPPTSSHVLLHPQHAAYPTFVVFKGKHNSNGDT